MFLNPSLFTFIMILITMWTKKKKKGLSTDFQQYA